MLPSKPAIIPVSAKLWRSLDITLAGLESPGTADVCEEVIHIEREGLKTGLMVADSYDDEALISRTLCAHPNAERFVFVHASRVKRAARARN